MEAKNFSFSLTSQQLRQKFCSLILQSLKENCKSSELTAWFHSPTFDHMIYGEYLRSDTLRRLFSTSLSWKLCRETKARCWMLHHWKTFQHRWRIFPASIQFPARRYRRKSRQRVAPRPAEKLRQKQKNLLPLPIIIFHGWNEEWSENFSNLPRFCSRFPFRRRERESNGNVI